MKKLLILITLFLNLLANDFDKYFNLAQNYYWLTVDEGIKTKVYFKTKKYINLAYKELQKYPNKDNQKKLNALDKELKNYFLLKYYTLDGFFPMIKYISTPFFFKTSKHILLIKPEYKAIKSASETLANNIKGSIQNHIFFNSKNPLWNVTLFDIFNSNGKHFSHLISEIDMILTEKEIKDFYSNKITPSIINKLLDYINKSKLYIVKIDKIPLEKEDIYFSATAYMYNKKGLVKDTTVQTFGYVIDERDNWGLIIAMHLFLFIFSFLISLKFIKYKKIYTLFLIVFISFVIGRFLPWIIVPSILNIAYNIWIVFAIGVAIIILPIYGVNILYYKAKEYISIPSIAGKNGIIGASITAGVAGYLFMPFIFTYSHILSFFSLVEIYLLYAFALMSLGYISGKILDRSDKTDEKYIIVCAFLSMIMFIALVHVDIYWMIFASIFTIISSLLLFKFIKKSLNKNKEIKIDINEDKFYKFNYYDDIIEQLKKDNNA